MNRYVGDGSREQGAGSMQTPRRAGTGTQMRPNTAGAGRTQMRRICRVPGRLPVPRSTLCVAVMFFMALAAPAHGTPTIQTLSNGYLVSNGLVSITFNTAGGVYSGYDGITSITFDGQQMVGSKGFYYDVQGSPNIYLNSTATWSYRTGSNFIDLSAEMPATTSQPVDVTWHWIIGDGQAGYSSYITYNHTAAMADWQSTENRLARPVLQRQPV